MADSTFSWTIETAYGELPIVRDADENGTVVVLAHGAGSHMHHRTLEWLSGLVRMAGASVVRFNFPYRAKGKSMPDRMPVLSAAYREVIAEVRSKLNPKVLVVGGHSMGGRVASMVLGEDSVADGLLLFGYPLHPPGLPDKLRDAHLPSITVPTLQINGANDEFCTPALMEQVRMRLDPRRWTLEWVEGADHSYHVKKATGRSRADVESDILRALKTWLPSIEPT